MKRFYKLLILFLVLFVPAVVKADMGAPVIKEYKATVIKTEGIDYYTTEYNKETEKYEKKKIGHLNNGDTFTVIYENDSKRGNNQDTYLEGSLKGGWEDRFTIYNEDVKWVKPVESEFVPNDSNIKDIGQHYKSKLKALTNVEVNLYKGPSFAYDVITTIPKDTEIYYEYTIGDGYDTGTTYIYVEYNGQKGWVNVLDGKILFAYDQKVITFEDIQTDCGTISEGTLFTSKYNTDMWTGSISYENNGCRALVHSFRSVQLAIYSDYDTYVEVTRDLDLYEKPRNKGSVVYTIKKGSQIKILYTNEWDEEYADYYFELDGKKGFAYLRSDSEVFKYIDKSKVTSTTTTTTTEEETTTTEETVSGETYGLNSNGNTSVNKTKEIIIISVIVGVALAVTAIVVIIIINKKNKKKIEEQPVVNSVTVETEVIPIETPVVEETPIVDEPPVVNNVEETQTEVINNEEN